MAGRGASPDSGHLYVFWWQHRRVGTERAGSGQVAGSHEHDDEELVAGAATYISLILDKMQGSVFRGSRIM